MIKLGKHQLKVVFTDIDGVWTDGGMYYGKEGEGFKKFNTSDSAGVLFLRKLAIPLVVLTGENSPAVIKRMEKLKIEHAYHGIQNKLQAAQAFCTSHNIDLGTETAFIGNDINDWSLLKKVGHSAVPSDAPEYIKKQARLVLTQKGGTGVFREYVEYIIQENIDLTSFIERSFITP